MYSMMCRVPLAARVFRLLALALFVLFSSTSLVAAQDWSGLNDRWRNIGGIFPPRAPVTAIARTPDIIDLFVTGNDGRVYTSWWVAGSDWSGVNDRWRNIGGFFPPGAPVAAVARKPGNIDLFITGNDGRVYTSWWVGGSDWSGLNDRWRNIGGIFPPGAPLSAVARTPDNLDVFVSGNDGRVYTSWWSAGHDWSGLNDRWRNIGGFFPRGAPVAAVARTPNNLDLFITGNDGRVYTSWWVRGSDWSGLNNRWRNIGGIFPAGAPLSAVARTSNNLDVFVTGNDGRVYTSWWVGGRDWSGLNDRWRNIGGIFPVGAPVTAVSRTPTNLDLFIAGNDGRVYTSWWTGSNDWSGLNNRWRNIGGVFPPGRRVAAIARKPGQLDLFINGNDGRIYTSWWPAAASNTRYNLIVSRFTTSTLTDADADRILGDAGSAVRTSDGADDVACPVEIARNGTVGVFSTGNGIIASTADFNAITGTNVAVVNVISFCSGPAGPGLSIIGCGSTPGNKFITVRIGAASEGLLWAHEFGHNKGLAHRAGTNFLMNPVLGATTNRVNAAECTAFRSATGVAPLPDTGAPEVTTIEIFVLRHYFEGIPYDQARAFGPAALPRLRELLADPANSEFQANIVSVIGIVGGPGASETLIEYVNSHQDRSLDPNTYRGALTAVMALGLVSNTGDERATGFLAERARALVAAQPASGALRLEPATVGQQAVLGLGLSGRPEADAVLQLLRGTQIRAIAHPSELLDVARTTIENVRRQGVAETMRLRTR